MSISFRRRMITGAAAVAVLMPAGFADAASAPTPLAFVKFTVAPQGERIPNELVNVEATFRNRSAQTVRGGRLQVFLTRKATTRPSGRPWINGKLDPIVPGKLAIQLVNGRLRGREGRYRVIVCLDSPSRARRCSVLPGALTVSG